jgi:pentatricopeptide repeat protein
MVYYVMIETYIAMRRFKQVRLLYREMHMKGLRLTRREKQQIRMQLQDHSKA